MNIVKTIREYLEKTENSDKHINKYVENIKKAVNGKYCVIGHLHKYVKNDNVEILDTYQKDVKYIINDKYIVFSDTHITNESSDEYLDKLLNDFYFYDDKKIVLLGDIFDFWVSDGDKMLENPKIREVVNFINNHNVIYIVGNHDYEVTKYFDVTTFDSFDDGDVVFYHGHQFDEFFNGSILGKMFLWIQLKIGDNIHIFNRWLKEKFYTE